jgi:large subunit ribosomal protein L29
MAIGSKDLTPEQLRGLENDPLRDALAEAKKELFNLRFQSATGQLESHGRLRAVRRDIARIYTEMRERELGIGQPPQAEQEQDEAEKTKEEVSQA